MKLLRRSPWLAGFLLASIIIVVRLWPRLLHPGLWAEDGTDFLVDAVQFGPRSLIRPYAGYFHTLPRIGAFLLTTLIPVRYFAQGVALLSGLTYAFVASMFARETFRELVPADALRVATVGILCLAPGQWEVLGNLTNVHALLAFGAWMLLLKPAKSELASWEIGFFVLTILSAGETVLLIPLLGYRIYARRRAQLSTSRELSIAVLILLFAFCSALLSRSFSNGQTIVWEWIPRAFWSLLLSGLVYWPWLGPITTEFLGRHANDRFYALWALAIATVVIVGVVRNAKWRAQMAIALGTIVALPVLTWIVRPGSADFFAHRVLVAELSWERYAFQVWMPVTLLWVCVLASLKASNERNQRVLIALFLFNSALCSLSLVPKLPVLGGDWETRAPEFERAVTAEPPVPIAIPIAPEPFVVRFPRTEQR